MSYNNLDDNSPKIIQPKNLNVELMQHQKTAVYALKDLESKGYVDIKFKYYDNEEKDLRINTNIGILGDRVGSGKTLIIASLLIESSQPKNRPTYFSSNKFTTIEEKISDDNKLINVNLIIVPKGIQHQWEDIFKHNIKFNDNIQFYNHCDSSTSNIFEKVNLSINNIILCNEVSVSDVIDKYKDKKLSRIIIDEADTIQLLSINNINASFIWLVTGTINGIFSSKKKYIKDIFDKNISWLPDFLTIKNNNSYIDMSFELPKPNRITIKCHTPTEILLLANHIPKNIMNMINAGNTDEAIKSLNCHVDTSDNIFKVISRNYQIAIKKKEEEINIAKKKKFSIKNEDLEIENKKHIKYLETVLDRLNNKLVSIKTALYQANDEICPICMDEYEKPTLVDCCAHKYCFNCLTITLEKLNNRCPICQTKITKNKMHIIHESEKNIDRSNKEKINKHDKLEELYQIIKNGTKTDRKFIVFADYDQTFLKIEKVFKQHKVKYGIFNGSRTKIKDTLDKFQNGNINVIMLNAKNFGAGMNLQCATDIILYHRFTDEIEEQIIGRGQRYGRKGTLNVYYLIHDNESDSFINDKFNDIDYQKWIEK